MKQFLNLALITIFIFSCSLSCNKSDTSNSPNDNLSAQIGSISFSANGSNVYALISPDTKDATKLELTITAQNGSNILTVAIHNFVKGTAGSYSFDTGAALGGYNSGSGGDDPIVSGTIIFSQNSNTTIQGTFSGSTQGGIAIKSGTFILNYQ